MEKIRLTTCILFIGLLLATLANAASIPIANYSFESPAFPTSGNDHETNYDGSYIWLHDPAGFPDFIWSPGDNSQGDPWLGAASGTWHNYSNPSDGLHMAICSWSAGTNCHVYQLLANTFHGPSTLYEDQRSVAN